MKEAAHMGGLFHFDLVGGFQTIAARPLHVSGRWNFSGGKPGSPRSSSFEVAVIAEYEAMPRVERSVVGRIFCGDRLSRP